jgi:2'-5' RNA ligase
LARLGVFLIPPPDHPFYRVTSDLLGYDIWVQHRYPSSLGGHLDSETLTRWLGEAPTFGIHCTIGGAALEYDDSDIDEIKERLGWIAGRTAPFTLTGGRFFDDFHARPRVLVTRFDSPDGAIERLHRQVATIVSPLYVASTYASRLPRLDERGRELYYRTGEPWALERFSPHWSLMTGTWDDSTWQAARDLVASQTGLFADARTRTIQVTDVHLVDRPDQGYCTVLASFPLTGTG